MRLVERSIRSRAFLLQYLQIMEEFGEEIPWLQPLKPISFSTNPNYFRDQFLRRLGCEEEEIVPYQLVMSDVPREFVGGILYFPRSPEGFKDRNNQEILERIDSEGYRFISCLQVRDVFRGQGYGATIMQRALGAILEEHKKIWGVVSNPSLLPWYASMGAKVLSPAENKDELWVVSFAGHQESL
jgi:GNAT superfamily N-acetyltransferase